MKTSKIIIFLLAFTFGMVSVSHAITLIGPLGGTGLNGEYASFNDSPFNGKTFSYFHFENFEDFILNTPGVVASGNSVFISHGGLTDSVDADDGIIDGNGSNGSSLWAYGMPGITFSFNESALGGFPTHAGIVWTDGLDSITLQAYDAIGTLLGNIVGNHADGSYAGTTVDDLFYGVISAGGISKIIIQNGGGGGIEVDHLQYGREVQVPVPEPATLLLVGLGLVGLAGVRRKFQK